MNFDRDDLQKIYSEKILPLQKKIKREKIIAWIKVLLLILISILGFIKIIDMTIHYSEKNPLVLLAFVLIIIVTRIPVTIYKFNNKIKKIIFPKLFKCISEDIIYNSKLEFPHKEFRDSELYDVYNCNGNIQDSISTKINNKDIKIFEFLFDSTSNNIEKTIFWGIFVNTIIDNPIKSDIRITSNKYKDYGLVKTIFCDANKVNLENIDFEKKYDVYCNDQIYARKLITLGFMEKLLNFTNRINKNIAISFKNKNIYMSIEGIQLIYDKNIFFKKIDFKMISNTVENIFEIIEMIKLLDLEEKIV